MQTQWALVNMTVGKVKCVYQTKCIENLMYDFVHTNYGICRGFLIHPVYIDVALGELVKSFFSFLEPRIHSVWSDCLCSGPKQWWVCYVPLHEMVSSFLAKIMFLPARNSLMVYGRIGASWLCLIAIII